MHFFLTLPFLYVLNVIDKTQMLPVSANRINHLLQKNGEKYLDNFFHTRRRRRSDRKVARRVLLADAFITRGPLGPGII